MLGYEPQVTFEDGLRRTWNHLLDGKGVDDRTTFGSIDELGEGYRFPQGAEGWA